ncbi:hypothetical protein MSPP1_001756 [Malassezia sp. CBS 17886]|nr:hypothetical protein MSPP1_001756 [Malassezia sp. CBS 17886]
MPDVALPLAVVRARDAAARRVFDVRETLLPMLADCRSTAQLADAESELQATLAQLAQLAGQLADEVDDTDSSAQRAEVQSLARAQAGELEGCVFPRSCSQY